MPSMSLTNHSHHLAIYRYAQFWLSAGRAAPRRILFPLRAYVLYNMMTDFKSRGLGTHWYALQIERVGLSCSESGVIIILLVSDHKGPLNKGNTHHRQCVLVGTDASQVEYNVTCLVHQFAWPATCLPGQRHPGIVSK